MANIEDILDIDMEETKEKTAEEQNSVINGRPITFKTGEVAEIIGETSAMTRHYCREFENYMTLDHKPGEHRSYTQKNIEELKYILGLIRDDGLSVKQVHEFLSSPEGKLAAPIFDQQTKIKQLIDAMVVKVDDRLQSIVKRELESTFTPLLKEALSNTIQNLPDKQDFENMNNNISKLKEEIDRNNDQLKKSVEESSISKEEFDDFEKNIEKFIDEKLKQKEMENKKGFFHKFFGKN